MANKNILEVAFSKIQENEKTELSNHEIQLGLLDGIERYIGKIHEDIERADGMLNKAGNDAERISKNAIIKASSNMESIDKAEEMARELGVTLPKIKELKQRTQKAEQRGKAVLKRANLAM